MATIKTINVELSSKGLQQLKNELLEFKSNLQNIKTSFIENSLDWIITQANYYFMERTRKHGSSSLTNIMQLWVYYPIDDNTYRLVNESEVGAYVEFGTGIVGKLDTNNRASQVGWQYDVNNHGNDGWTYYNEEIGAYVHTKGYAGKSFLYDAFWDYFYHKEYLNILNQTINGTYSKQYTGRKIS